MNIYAIVCFEDANEDFEQKIKTIDSDAYLVYAPRSYFMKFNGTAKALSDRLNFRSGGSGIPGLVIKVNSGSYYGYARRDIWPYLEQADG